MDNAAILHLHVWCFNSSVRRFSLPSPLRMLWLAACVVAREITSRATRDAPQTGTPGPSPRATARAGHGGHGAAGGGIAADTEVQHTSRDGEENRAGTEDPRNRRKSEAATVIFCDGVSAPVPFLRLAGPVRVRVAPIIFS